jgi:nitrite reductase/ring-hydroxylating ferredoxin subunit
LELMAVDVGALEEFEEGTIRIVQAGRQRVGILRWPGGRLYAVRDFCPHQGGPVCEGAVGRAIRGGADGPTVVDDSPVLMCGWHHWEFDLETGRALGDPRMRLRTYDTRVDGGRVLVEVQR